MTERPRVPSPSRRLPIVAGLACVLAAAGTPAQEQVTVEFGTDTAPSGWLITGAGVEDTPARVVTIYPGYISFSSNGTATGQFIPGASWGAFDGVWTADFSFALPRRAQDVYLDFYDLFADDRVVLSLNGTPIGNATLNGDYGAGQHTFAPGEQEQPFTFTQTRDGRIDEAGAFIYGSQDPRGSQNVLTLSVNNNGTGDRTADAQALPPSSYNGTVVRLRGLLRWIEDYQIRPYPNPSGNTMEVDDDPHGWYNAVWFDNAGGLTVAHGGTLTNRTGATLVNSGLVLNNGQVVMDGSYKGQAGSSFTNIGAMTVVGTMEEYGTFINTGNLGLLQNSSFTYGGQGPANVFENTGRIYNQGTFAVVGSGTQYSGSPDATVRFTNTGWFIVNGGAVATESINNSGHVVVTGDSVLVGNVANAKLGDMQISGGGVFSGGMRNEGDAVVQAGGRYVSSSGGTLLNDGGNLIIEAGGAADIGIGGSLVNQGPFARLQVSAGGFLNVAADSSLENVGGTIKVEGSAEVLGRLSNAGGVIGVSSGGQLRLGGDAQNPGTIIVSDASLLEIGPRGRLYAYAPGQIYLEPGSVLAVQGRLEDDTVNCSGARITGRGTITATATLNLSGCTIGPGNSPGTLTIDGQLNVDQDSAVEMEIGSPDDYDRLVLGGGASFAPGARVNVSFVDGYLPDARDDFAWLSTAGAVGAEGLRYDVPYEGWQFDAYTDYYVAPVPTTHLQLASVNALDLGGGLQAGRVIGAGEVAFVEPTGPYGDYENGGVLDNSGVVHNRAGSQFVNLNLYSVSPGTLVNRSGAWFVNRGFFVNDINVGPSIDNAGTFYNHASGVLENRGEIHNAADGRFVNRGVVENGGGAARIVNEGRFENRGEIVNTETIENSGEFVVAAGASLHGAEGQRGYYTQFSGRTQVDGLLDAEQLFINGGTLGGNGRLAGMLVIEQFGGGGTLDPGDPLAAGRLELTGDLFLTGLLHVDIAGEALHDVLAIDGQASGTGGTLEVALLQGYRPKLGDAFDFLTVSNPDFTLSFANTLFPALDPGLAWEMLYSSAGGSGTLRLAVTGAVVPAPATFALFGTALAGLGAAARRRRAVRRPPR